MTDTAILSPPRKPPNAGMQSVEPLDLAQQYRPLNQLMWKCNESWLSPRLSRHHYIARATSSCLYARHHFPIESIDIVPLHRALFFCFYDSPSHVLTLHLPWARISNYYLRPFLLMVLFLSRSKGGKKMLEVTLSLLTLTHTPREKSRGFQRITRRPCLFC